MNLFLVGAALLTVLTTLLLLSRRGARHREADLGDPNLAWYQQRSNELGAGDGDAPAETLEAEARLRLLEDGAAAVQTGEGDGDRRGGEAGRGPGPWLIVPVLLLASALYWQLGAYTDVLIHRDLLALEAGDERVLDTLGSRIRLRSAQRPENAQYLGLLGQLQVAEEDFQGAADTFQRLAALAPNSAEAQAQAAQSRFLAAGRVLDSVAQRYAEKALAINPQQTMALGLLGMVSFEAGQFGEAVGYWRRLQAQEVQGSPGYQMLEDVIAIALERSPDAGGAGATADSDVGITVTVAAPPDASMPADAVLYVFARDPAAASRMPIAVRRLRAAELPVTLRLSDADSMAGQRLSAAGSVVISAQLSRNGQPGIDNAAYTGSAAPAAAGDTNVVVTVALEPVDGGT